MKVLAWIATVGTLIVAVVYMVVSLNRWEWNRALFFGLIALMAEVAAATGLLMSRMARRAPRDDDPAIRAALSESRPASPNRFRWLEESTRQLDVFIMFLVGGGVMLSGIAWVVDRVASVTSTPAGERHLARELQEISYPRGGLLVDEMTVLAQEVPGTDDVQIRRLLRRAGHRP
jgi:hypothetical protein